MKCFFYLILLISHLGSYAQEEVSALPEIIYQDSIVNIKPNFPGGIEDCYKYFAKKIALPQIPALVDKVVLTFIVETDGTLTDIRVIHDAGFGLGEQVAALLEAGPKWIPGSHEGKKVRVFKRLPIPIVTED